MTHKQHSPKTPSPRTGIFAVLDGLLRVKGSGARSTGPKDRVSLGRSTAVKTFTRNSNKGVMSRIGRQATTKRISTNQGCAAHLRNARFLLPAFVLAGLLFTAAPALAAGKPEAPVTVEPGEVKATTAVLQGVVNPLKVATVSWFFEYKAGSVCTGGSTTPVEGPAEVEAQPVAVGIESLTANTKYAVCLVAENEAKEQTEGNTIIFTTATPPEVPVTKSPASLITSTTATLEGTLNPHGTATTKVGWYFAYSNPGGTSCLEGPNTGEEPKVEGKALVEHKTLGELQPHQKYVFCMVAVNSAGETAAGNEVPFETKPAPPTIESEGFATPVKAGEVHLEGTVNPNNQLTECHFQYGEKELSEYDAQELAEKTVPCEPPSLPAGFGEQPVGANVGSLNPKTVYHYRIVAKNGTGEEETGKDETFKTAMPPETPEVLSPDPVAFTTATLKGLVNPKEPGNPGTYQFVYQQSAVECEHYNEVEEIFEIVSETKPIASTAGEKVAAQAPVEKLLPGTTYTYCLLAHNEAGEESPLSAPETFTTPAEAPTIPGEYVTKVHATEVTLNAQIDPGGAETKYHFEYIDQAGYEAALAESAPNPYAKGMSTPEAKLEGSLTTTDTATVTIMPLQPGMTYHYRVVATSSLSPAGGTPGADETFTTPVEPSTAAETCPNAQARTEQPYGQTLPDCRAYELVSPLDKDDNGVEAANSRASVSDEPSGSEASALAYTSKGSFSEPQGSKKTSRYISRRAADGWSTQNVTPPAVAYESGRVPFSTLLFTPGLSTGLLESEDVPLVHDGELPGYDNLYVADLATTQASYQTVTNVNPPGAPPYTQAEQGPKPVGVSTDLSRVVFEQGANLTANAEGNGEHVYDWTNGKLSLVDVPPPGTKFEHEDQAGAPGNTNLPEDGDTWHAVSANGLRVFFTAGKGNDESEGQLYVRENPERPPVDGSECAVPGDACTVEVSASQRTIIPDPNGPQPAYYRDASAEGTRVFFTSRAELTNEANTDEDKVANLYEYNVETKELTDLTAENPEGAAVLGLVTASENVGEENSYVYFVANGVLASNENANKETAQPGHCRKEGGEQLIGEPTCNLYVDHYEGGKWETKFIAMLTSGHGGPLGNRIVGDEYDWLGYEGGTLTNDQGPGSHTARVTPDGTTLAFESERSLTGYDNNPVEPGAGVPGHKCTEQGGVLQESDPAVPCREVYVYDAVTEKLVCASCDPSGARPVGPAELGGQEIEGFLAPSVYYLPRNLSEDGGRLFFQSPDALMSHDSDNQLDVYEWERLASPAEAAKGENSCTSSSPTFSASDGGCVFPISDVAGDFESKFMDATPSGNNVFIATKDQLVPEADADSRANVYDVRVGGGFPVSVSPPACNNGDACKPPVSPQPGVFAPPASATFSGPGNATSAPAATVTPRNKTAAEIKAEKLAKALKQCKKEKKKSKRANCEKQARKRYGASKAKRAKRAGNDGRAK
jgi:hypothetical protein